MGAGELAALIQSSSQMTGLCGMRKAFRFRAGSVMLKPKLSTTGAAGRHQGRIPTRATLALL